MHNPRSLVSLAEITLYKLIMEFSNSCYYRDYEILKSVQHYFNKLPRSIIENLMNRILYAPKRMFFNSQERILRLLANNNTQEIKICFNVDDNIQRIFKVIYRYSPNVKWLYLKYNRMKRNQRNIMGEVLMRLTQLQQLDIICMDKREEKWKTYLENHPSVKRITVLYTLDDDIFFNGFIY